MLRNRLCVAALTISAISVSLSCGSFPIEPYGLVNGTVRDASTDETLEGVLVEVGGGSEFTDAGGQYAVWSKGGDRTIRATKEGYEPFQERIDVCSELCDDTDNRHDFRMTPL